MEIIKNNINNLKDIIGYCVLSQKQLKNKLSGELKKYYRKVKSGNGFLFARGNMPIMLVAHIDTVHKEQCNINNIFLSLDGNVLTSNVGIGGDDRCGVYMIMYILKNTALRPYVLFCEDEEIGGIGSNKFVKRYNSNNLKLNYIIQLDRAYSNDSVYYDLDNKDFEKYINKFGFETAIGSFTDICHLCPALNCAGVNLSCGYYNQHTTKETINIKEMMTTTNKVIEILKNAKDSDYFAWKEIEYTSIYRNDSNYLNNYYYYKYGYSNDKSYCAYCGQLKNIEDLIEDETGEYVCEDCIKSFNLHVCDNCGVVVSGDNKKCCYCDERWEDNDAKN